MFIWLDVKYVDMVVALRLVVGGCELIGFQHFKRKVIWRLSECYLKPLYLQLLEETNQSIKTSFLNQSNDFSYGDLMSYEDLVMSNFSKSLSFTFYDYKQNTNKDLHGLEYLG